MPVKLDLTALIGIRSNLFSLRSYFIALGYLKSEGNLNKFAEFSFFFYSTGMYNLNFVSWIRSENIRKISLGKILERAECVNKSSEK